MGPRLLDNCPQARRGRMALLGHQHSSVRGSLALSGFVGEHVFGPRVQGPRALLGEIVTLVDGGDTAELRRLMSEKLIDGDRVEAEPRERRGAGPPQVVQAPRDERCGFRGGCGRSLGTRLSDRRIETGLRPRETGNRSPARCAEDEVADLTFAAPIVLAP